MNLLSFDDKAEIASLDANSTTSHLTNRSHQESEAFFEQSVHCDPCGACCREAFDSVPVTPEDRLRLRDHNDLVRQHEDGWVDLERVPAASGCGTQCAALSGDGSSKSPFRCAVYSLRPTNCRDLAPGSRACFVARKRVGLSGR